MTSATALTGRTGRFMAAGQLVARTTGWEVNPTLASKSEWGDSDGAGWTNRASGRRDATFTSEGKYDTADEQFDIFQQGDIAIVTLFLDALTYYDFPRALIDDFTIVVDIDTEEVIGFTVAGGADGPMTFPGEAGQEARALP